MAVLIKILSFIIFNLKFTFITSGLVLVMWVVVVVFGVVVVMAVRKNRK